MKAKFIGSEAGFNFDLDISWEEKPNAIAEGNIQFKLVSKNSGLKALLKAQVDYSYKSSCKKTGELYGVDEVAESWRISVRGKTLFEKVQSGSEFKSKIRTTCYDLVYSFFLADAGKVDQLSEFDIAFPNRCYHVTAKLNGERASNQLVARSGPLAAEFLGSPIEKMTARYGGKKLPIPLPLDFVTLTRVP